MGTYFHGNSEIQGGGDGLQTLILMNRGYVGYSDSQPPGSNFVFLNSNNAGSSIALPHAPPPQPHQFVGIPLTATTSSPDLHTPPAHPQHDISALPGFHLPRAQYNFYNNPSVDIEAARDVTRAQQGLSLSLSSQQYRYGSFRAEREALVSGISPTSGNDIGGSLPSVSGTSNAVSVLMSSKYLRAVQELLDEVVNVGSGFVAGVGRSKNLGESSSAEAASGNERGRGEVTGKRATELTTAERHEIQMKKAKLVNMLDDVEQRYRQYHNQMQIVINWFEQVAGIGSSRTYTALALQTISKQFRCLKDAILGQIRAASNSLGGEGVTGGEIEGSRLRFVDNQLRQQRAMQQLGMIQHNAWRPQRGLPERAVSVLRSWLFEHFLHPYPKDSDKIMLAKQTGLTRSQVSNWFINARVRLWKPMVEEMYLEEVKDQEQNGTQEKTIKSRSNEDSTSKSNDSQEKFHISGNQNSNFNPSFQIPELIGTSETERSMAKISPKKPRSNDVLHSPSSVSTVNVGVKSSDGDHKGMPMKFGEDRRNREGIALMGQPTNFIGGFGSYNIGEISRFGSDFAAPYLSNGVSLTLGLPHGESISVPGAQHTFLPNQSMQLGIGVGVGEANEFGGMTSPPTAHKTSVYETIHIENRKRFATQVLQDFVS